MTGAGAWVSTDAIERALLDSLRALAGDPNKLLAAWRRDRTPWHTPDELALTFDDAFSVLEHRTGPDSSDPRDERRWLLAVPVNAALDALNSAGDEIWSDEWFRDHPRWEEVRRRAAAAIAAWDRP